MKRVDLPLPLFGFAVATRAALGVGIGLLLASRFRQKTRCTTGWTLVTLGALTTIPIAAFLLRGGLKPGPKAARAAA
jgi:hypothetical protein